MQLVILSGSSGSGKSTALQALEDLDLYCIDNLPIDLLSVLIKIACDAPKQTKAMAVSIDARNLSARFEQLPELIESLRKQPEVKVDVAYLDAQKDTLLRRFSATRRKHPLSNAAVTLSEALEHEQALLGSLAQIADLRIDTTNLNVHELRNIIQHQFHHSEQECALIFQSFSYRDGVPLDADFVFDVRCLPNPHWIVELSHKTGQDQEVIEFFKQQSLVQQFINEIAHLIGTWLPEFMRANRKYITLAIGCTGGQHRSVYVTERLADHFKTQYRHLMMRHRELHKHKKSSTISF